MWPIVLIASAGCYALKLAGHSVPQTVLGRPRVRRIPWHCWPPWWRYKRWAPGRQWSSMPASQELPQQP